jgi:seryl-tRNA synthetase
MHDVRSLRDQLDELRRAMQRRGKLDLIGPLLDEGATLEQERRTLIQAGEERKAARNASSQEVARRRKAGEDAADLITLGRELGDEIRRLEEELAVVESRVRDILLSLPNVTLPDVPAGGEEANTVVRTWGTPRPSDGVRPHWEVGEALGVLDLPRGAKVSGSGFIVYRGGGARLTRALLNFFLDVHVREHGYEEVWVPAVANRAAMTGTAQLPRFEDDMYAVRDEDLFLIPTAEVPITNLYRDELLEGATLPRAFVGYTPCFRREAGAAGKDTRGLLRVHQFDKVEMVRYCRPEDGDAEHEGLGLPYRRVLLAAGDTGFASARTWDLEVWAPGVGKWLEVSSCSTFTDFQARRAGIRFRPAAGGKPQFVHTLNGSGLAFPRVIACILEHYQRADGSVTVPEVLRPWMGVETLS